MRYKKVIQARTLIFAIVLLLIQSCSTSHQLNSIDTRNIVNLQWAYFMGKVPKKSPYSATTYWRVSYHRGPVEFVGKRAIVDITVDVELKKKSWVRPDEKTDELLKHEQGHYDLGRMCALELKQQFKKSVFTSNNYTYEISSVFKETFRKYVALDKQYDAETNHMMDTVAQRRWNDLLIKMEDNLWRAE